MSHFPENKQEFSIYLSWDKNFIARAKKSIQILRHIFSYFYWVLIRPHCGTSNEYPQHVLFQITCIREKEKVSFFGKYLVNFGRRTRGFDHLLLSGQVIRFDNFTTLAFIFMFSAHTVWDSCNLIFFFFFFFLHVLFQFSSVLEIIVKQ